MNTRSGGPDILEARFYDARDTLSEVVLSVVGVDQVLVQH